MSRWGVAKHVDIDLDDDVALYQATRQRILQPDCAE
jgi:hypothetical protein